MSTPENSSTPPFPEEAMTRLRAERDALAKRRQDEAETAGSQWALAADFEGLERVAALFDDPSVHAHGQWRESLIAAALGDDSAPLGERVGFLTAQLGRTEVTDEEAKAFVWSASTVFEKV